MKKKKNKKQLVASFETVPLLITVEFDAPKHHTLGSLEDHFAKLGLKMIEARMDHEREVKST